MSEFHIPGMAISLVRNNKIHWIKGFGWADIENEVPMDPIRSIQNIGSISKTITATAIMQLWENNLFSLDDDVNDHLDIRIRNPHYPDVPITFRQLLAHRSSIMDGDSYGQSYRCGDPAVSLSSWIRDYFTPGGQFYDADGNFHHWKPGREDPLPEFPRSYSNVGFGLLGYLVEVLSGERFETYTRKHIFEPLEMMDTAWFIKDIETDRHATPYTYMSEDMELPPGFSYEMALPKYAEEVTPIQTGAYFPHCLYSFYNYPDGLLRTTAHDLSHFMICYLQGGLFHDRRILEKHTINKMYQPPYQAEITRGLCWDITGINDRRFIGHGGGDPGINTLMYFDPDASEGMLILTNSSAANLREMMAYLLKEIE
jgi:CubicO group peptidase (beta-lactamase class C family)